MTTHTTRQMTFGFGKQARMLAAALAIGATVVSLSAAPAHAEPKTPAVAPKPDGGGVYAP
jgi:hypothetical protein